MQNSVPLRQVNTFKIGGKAKYFVVCCSFKELYKSVMWCKNNGFPWFILGGGSNILISDDGYPGLVIKLGGKFKEVNFYKDIVEVGGGVFLPVLSRRFLNMQWGGFEFMCDIPGTIGGAVRINAGTKQGEIRDHFISATILTSAGEVETIYKKEMDFAYRNSILYNSHDIVVSVRFSLPFLEDKDRILEKMRHIHTVRRQKQPLNRRNCGSVFKNPPSEKSGGWYIDQAGLKGARVGDAMVACEHANWIVNMGSAKAKDVKNLINKIQHEVYGKFGVCLEREVFYVPEDVPEDVLGD